MVWRPLQRPQRGAVRAERAQRLDKAPLAVPPLLKRGRRAIVVRVVEVLGFGQQRAARNGTQRRRVVFAAGGIGTIGVITIF